MPDVFKAADLLNRAIAFYLVELDQADRHKISAVADDPKLTPRLLGEFVASLRAR